MSGIDRACSYPGEEIPQSFYHLVVHVWIRNSKGEYLIFQRGADRPTAPLMWECVVGRRWRSSSVAAGYACWNRDSINGKLENDYAIIV